MRIPSRRESKDEMPLGRLACIIFAVLLCAACSRESVFELSVGTCFNDEEGEEIVSIPVVECSEPHDNEVYALFDLSDGPFPGDDAIGELSFDGCLDRFKGYVGKSYKLSDLALTYLFPTADSWTVQNDREVVCYLYRVDLARMTGTMKDSGI